MIQWKNERIEGFVYKWTNKINGRWYIGSHNGKKSNYIGSGIAFRNVIKQHGIENFSREILYVGFDFREKEEQLLVELGAAADLQSYNLKNEALGGSFPGQSNGMKKGHTLEAKKKISESASKLWTEEKKESKSIEMSGAGNPMFGKTKSQFSLDKERQTKKASHEEWGFLGDINGKHHKTFFMKMFRDLRDYSKEVSPRGQLVKEIENYSYELPPYVRFQNFESRKFNLNYVKKEFLWYLRGDKYDLSICDEAKIWKQIVNEDGSLNSNYGQYVFGTLNQFDRAVDALKGDKDSRRASIVILHSSHLLSDTKDVPCTYSINFRIRENRLNMSVRMRSQDAIFGAANDIPTFSLIHEMAFVSLRECYPELEYGNYHHTADSFHVYSRHFEMLDKLLAKDKTTKSDTYRLILCPKISSAAEVTFIRQYAVVPKDQIGPIPEGFKFAKWLTEIE